MCGSESILFLSFVESLLRLTILGLREIFYEWCQKPFSNVQPLTVDTHLLDGMKMNKVPLFCKLPSWTCNYNMYLKFAFQIVLNCFSECFSPYSIDTHPIRLGCRFHFMHLCSLFFFNTVFYKIFLKVLSSVDKSTSSLGSNNKHVCLIHCDARYFRLGLGQFFTLKYTNSKSYVTHRRLKALFQLDE